MYPVGMSTAHVMQLLIAQQIATTDFERVVSLNEKLSDNLTDANKEIIRLKQKLSNQAKRIQKLEARLRKRPLDDQSNELKRRKIAPLAKQNPPPAINLAELQGKALAPSSGKLIELDTSIPAFEFSESSSLQKTKIFDNEIRLFSNPPPSGVLAEGREPDNPEFLKDFVMFEYFKNHSKCRDIEALKGSDAFFSQD